MTPIKRSLAGENTAYSIEALSEYKINDRETTAYVFISTPPVIDGYGQLASAATVYVSPSEVDPAADVGFALEISGPETVSSPESGRAFKKVSATSTAPPLTCVSRNRGGSNIVHDNRSKQKLYSDNLYYRGNDTIN